MLTPRWWLCGGEVEAGADFIGRYDRVIADEDPRIDDDEGPHRIFHRLHPLRGSGHILVLVEDDIARIHRALQQPADNSDDPLLIDRERAKARALDG